MDNIINAINTSSEPMETIECDTNWAHAHTMLQRRNNSCTKERNKIKEMMTYIVDIGMFFG